MRQRSLPGLALLAIFLLALAACALSPAREGKLRLSISSSVAKTVLPVLAPASYRLSFSGPETLEPVSLSGPSATLELAAGSWSITVQGFDSESALIAEGEATGIRISPGATTSVAIRIYAAASASGFVDLTLTWPASLSPPVSGASVELDGAGAAPSDFSLGPAQLRYAEALPSGSHSLLIALQSGGATVYVWESVQVYDNLTSSATIGLTAEDFTEAPAAPADLAAEAVAGGIGLSWTDSSHVETSYAIERGFDGASYSPIATLDYNVTSYTDTTASEGQPYWYRVLARNDRGEAGSAVRGQWGQASQIIADHTIVAEYAQIPEAYVALVKKMWLDLPGESHSEGYRAGLAELAAAEPKFAVSVTESGTPEGATDTHLRASRATWGDLINTTGWLYGYGEEDWYTSETAIARTKAHLDYCDANGFPIDAMGFGWCWDLCWANDCGGTEDPVYLVRWAGSSVGGPQGNARWGLDSGDAALTGNSVCMDSYLAATQAYIDYCAAQGYPTKVFFTTGTVDSYEGEVGYQGYLKNEHIRAYAAADSGRILFDYADILCYDEGGSQRLKIFTDSGGAAHEYPIITYGNLGDAGIGHIGAAGRLRLAKALWWMLARMAGWNGVAE